MIEKIKKIVGVKNVIESVSLKEVCTFKIGGTANALVMPKTFGELFELVDLFKENTAKYKVIGNASNILFDDKHLDLYIISTKNLCGYEINASGQVVVSAGANTAVLLKDLQALGLSGLEFLAGVPATLGGAIKMNAGAFGFSISDTLQSVTFLENGFLKTRNKEELCFGYRTSYFTNNDSAIILFAEFNLTKVGPEKVKEKIEDNLNARGLSQPKGFSAGSVFKNLSFAPIGKLVDELGLKGKTIGGAKISEKHGNFIINTGNATFKDVKDLITYIKLQVYKTYGEVLETEIEIIE